MKINVQDLAVTSLIPQRAPMVMISSVVSAQRDRVESLFEIAADNMFVENGRLLEAGLLENIAQTAAALVGINSLESGTEVPLGFIGGINKVAVYQLPAVGETIRTEIEVLQEVFQITLIQGRSYWGEKLLIECQMKIVVNP